MAAACAVRCGNCHIIIDGVRVRLAPGKATSPDGLTGLCRECRDEPDCDLCHRTPEGHGITLLPIEGEDAVHPCQGSLAYCKDCIESQQALGIRVQARAFLDEGGDDAIEVAVDTLDHLLSLVHDIPVRDLRVLPKLDDPASEEEDEDEEDEPDEPVPVPTFTVVKGSATKLMSVRELRERRLLARRYR